jgi:hypothetical protein
MFLQARKELLQVLDTTKPSVSNKHIYFLRTGEYRIIEHPQTRQQFLLKNGVTTHEKFGNDTLSFSLQHSSKIAAKRGPASESMFIRLTGKNVQTILNIAPASLDSALAVLKQDIPVNLSAHFLNRKKGTYNMVTGKWTSPFTSGRNSNKVRFSEDLQFGFQYVRGAWSPSVAAGFNLNWKSQSGDRDMLKLLWEPYFFFSKNSVGKTITERNDFVTLRFMQEEQNPDPSLIAPGIAIGYLINRQGDWFNKNTFKTRIIGLKYGWLHLEPEFFFNNLFRDFSPSLRLLVVID